ncbi:hypothetical protein [Streptomyces sp. NRRL S-1868]|uniref:hypothetical protein n=1 Tax=Streptomyces sp. NRRL S-1868 TaxID=1463892 RepID=UPI0004CBFB67|nr:hypothetical protein [Streptomyces sp. NRRL S-1868]
MGARMTTETGRAPVLAFATGLLRTTVYEQDDGRYRWERARGDAAPAAFRYPDETLLPVLTAAESAGARFVLAADGTEPRRYTVPGWQSCAHRLLVGGHQACAAVTGPLAGAGGLLRAVHDQPPPPGAAPPPGLLRLSAWLDGTAERPDAARSAEFLRPLLGAPGWARLRAWSDEALQDRSAALHGAPGLGALVPGEGTGTGLLAGEDVAAGPPLWDLGWIVGELMEFQWRLAAKGGTQVWHELLRSLLRAYGISENTGLRRMAVLRIALHLHDFIAYVGWDQREFARAAAFLGHLIKESRE